jgi:hypothetical protein
MGDSSLNLLAVNCRLVDLLESLPGPRKIITTERLLALTRYRPITVGGQLAIEVPVSWTVKPTQVYGYQS